MLLGRNSSPLQSGHSQTHTPYPTLLMCGWPWTIHPVHSMSPLPRMPSLPPLHLPILHPSSKSSSDVTPSRKPSLIAPHHGTSPALDRASPAAVTPALLLLVPFHLPLAVPHPCSKSTCHPLALCSVLWLFSCLCYQSLSSRPLLMLVPSSTASFSHDLLESSLSPLKAQCQP